VGQWQDHHLLLDLYLSDSLTKKYVNTNKPHVRMTERVIAPERLDFLEVVSSSHNHTDHVDGETLSPLLEANPNLTMIVLRANINFAAERLQISPERLTILPFYLSMGATPGVAFQAISPRKKPSS
jgi:L-ascorbate metabolism protein UlaG (beta-lactamase superfamily)